MMKFIWTISLLSCVNHILSQDTLRYSGRHDNLCCDSSLKEGIWITIDSVTRDKSVLTIENTGTRTLFVTDSAGRSIFMNRYFENYEIIYQEMFYHNNVKASAGFLFNLEKVGLWEYYGQNGKLESREFWQTEPAILEKYKKHEYRLYDSVIVENVYPVPYIDSANINLTPQGDTFYLILFSGATFQEYFADGKRAVDCVISKDSNYVIRRGWYENGRQSFEEEYVSGYRTGFYKEWDNCGNLIVQGLYDKNRKIGIWVYYDRKGKVIKREDHGYCSD